MYFTFVFLIICEYMNKYLLLLINVKFTLIYIYIEREFKQSKALSTDKMLAYNCS